MGCAMSPRLDVTPAPICSERHTSIFGVTIRSATVLLALALFAGCGADSTGGGGASGSEGSGAAPAPTDPTGPGPSGEHEWFTDTAVENGLDFVHFNGASGEFYSPEIMAPGVGLLDYDNDGDLDVYLVQGQMLGAEKTIGQALFPPAGAGAARGAALPQRLASSR